VHRLTIEYVTPSDVAAFDDHYETIHVPLAEKIPGLRRLVRSRPHSMRGQAPHLVVELWFDDQASLEAALTSPEMAAAAADARTMGVDSAMFAGDVVESVR
jgi:uncharacterized protein (TIGR02118 family)